MQTDRSERVAEIVDGALELLPEDCPGYLDRVCREDAALRAEVESLLGFRAHAESFIETPALAAHADFFSGDASSLGVGDVLGDYRIVSLLGEGGMGEVYLADDTTLGRKVAIKLLKFGLGTAHIVRHFQREQRILAGLTHPNIARLYGGATTGKGLPYFVMEYVEGTRLDEYCRAGHLSISERLALFRKICAAVSYAHQHLVIHRDIKPANIRVTVEGEPKLLDFGIATLLDPETSTLAQTMTLGAVMTPEYASPEQVLGGTITTASDVYSLGVVLYELLTGQKPYVFGDRTTPDQVRAMTREAPARPSTALSKKAASGLTEKRAGK